MKTKHYLLIVVLLLSSILLAQKENDGHSHDITDNESFIKGGFGEFRYLKEVGKDNSKGELDIPHLALQFGYLLNEKWYFFGKVGVEHLEEIGLELLYLNYKFNPELNLRAGLLLMPIGFHNQEHMPTAFRSVRLPMLYGNIIPTEWNELGIGVEGEWHDVALSYQLYLTTGLTGFTDKAMMGGARGIVGAKQKSHKKISQPVLSGRLQYAGIPNSQIGVSGYLGKTESDLYEEKPRYIVDSSSVTLSMLTLDAMVWFENLSLRGEIAYVNINNAEKFNTFTQQNLGNAMLGYYVELAYNLAGDTSSETSLVPFVRYGFANVHESVPNNLKKDRSYEKQEFVVGCSYRINKNVLLKADYNKISNKMAYSQKWLSASISFLW